MAKGIKKEKESNVVTISSINGFLKVISEITNDSPTGFFIYRGQGDYEGVESGAYRRLKKYSKATTPKLIEYQEQLINGARKRDDTHISIKNACDIIVLGEIQHFGGATSLIDFTYNSLTALYFACKSSKTPVKVYCLKTDDTSKFYKISQADSHNSGDKNDESDSKYVENLSIRGMINKLDSVDSKSISSGSKKYLMWNPPFKNNRILKQDSVFIFNGEGKIDEDEFTKIIKIRKSKEIAISLEKFFNISEESLFPDFVGYVEANSFSKPVQSISADYYLDKALEYHQRGEYENAIRNYTKAIELKPDLVDAFTNRGIAYDDLKKYDEAIADFSKAIELKPDDSEVYLNRGLTFYTLKKYDEANADYTKAIELYPDFEEAYYNRGASYTELKKYDEAIADFTKAIEIDPDFAEGYYNLGTVYGRELQKYDKAIAYLTKSIELKPNLEMSYNNRGIVFGKLQKYNEEIADYTKAIELKPDNAVAYHNRAIGYRNLEEYNKSIADYTKAIELNPVDTFAFINRGAVYGLLQKYDKAIADYTKAIEIEPDYTEVHLNLIEANILVENYGEAEKIISEAFALKPELEELFTLIYLKCIVMKLNDKDVTKAENELEELLKEEVKLDWSFKEIEDWLGKVKISEEKREYIKRLIEKMKMKL